MDRSIRELDKKEKKKKITDALNCLKLRETKIVQQIQLASFENEPRALSSISKDICTWCSKDAFVRSKLQNLERLYFCKDRKTCNTNLLFSRHFI